MILKTPDYQKAIDAINQLLESGRIRGGLQRQLKYEVAGIVAEKQVAYQLMCYFQNSDDIYVYNNLAIENGEAAAQIDHLVFSRRAVYFIESKSVAGTIHVNENGEFQRRYGRESVPMDSPIEQVKRQKTVLIDYLKAHRTEFLGKILFLQKGIGSWTPKYYVVISEKGTIKGPGRDRFKELMKYDQVASAISEHHKQTNVGFLKSLDDESHEAYNLLNKDEINRVCDFLKKSDTSKEPVDKINALLTNPKYKKDILPETTTIDSPPDEKKQEGLPVEVFSCAKCNSHKLQILFGKSYYFKCTDCGGNTPIKLTCEKCSGPMRIRKQKDNFYKVCKPCGTDQRYFINRKEA